MTVLAYLPSPDRGVWHLGPVPIRAYALCILLGVVVGVVWGDRRWRARGGRPGTVADLATIVVPAGIVGARLYHVVTSPSAYLDDPVSVLYIWEGGLGIPGGIAGGAIAAWLLARRRGIRTAALCDALAPCLAVAQAIGRFGNWFNQELFGRPTTLPWGLEIDPDNPDAVAGAEAYHPTFLYEASWNVLLAAALVWADRRFRLGGGRVFALYVGGYAIGRFWVEGFRIDDSETFVGLRLNQLVAVVALVGALAFLTYRRGAGRELEVEPLASDEAGSTTDSRTP
ncbi:MAG TPA: prolipoprotein diacylglyceryl transferase [Mycobacteriales bacterium]|nr:prolipoprotein diacylglyceryl transferase [Mycobacteriales bacterium]